MWREMARIIHEVQPRFAFVENSPMLTSRGLGAVLGDLAAMGFDARWGVLGAADVGANHQRDRIWIVAKRCGHVPHPELHGLGRRQQQTQGVEEEDGEITNPTGIGSYNKENKRIMEGEGCCEFQSVESRHTSEMANPYESQCQGNECTIGIKSQHAYACSPSWWQTEPDVGRVVDGLAARVDRLKAIGNGQVPLCAATAFRILSKDL